MSYANAKTMGNQGKAPRVAELIKTIENDPFSACFFLISLYDKKEKELMNSNPEYFNQSGNGHTGPQYIKRLRTELILVSMYEHILKVKLHGLNSLRENP